MNGSPPEQQRTRPSLLAANLFLLLGLLVIIWMSGRSQDTAVHYLTGVAAEIALAAGALLFIRLEGLPVAETLRLRWPSAGTMALSALLGLGLWAIGVIVNLIASLLFGYTAPMPPTVFPRTLPEALAMLLATVVAAPLCEETMFRGYIQRAYARRSPWIGIGAGGLIFALFHLRFQGVFALIPIALALGFLAWRTQSLLPSIVLHAAYNSISSLVLIATTFLSMQVVGGVVLALICTATLTIPLVFAILWYLWRATEPPSHPTSPALTGARRWLWIVPMGALALIYGYAAVYEVVMGRFPEVLASETLELRAPEGWARAQRWTYELQAGVGQTVGEATCTLTPHDATFELTCQSERRAFESDLPVDLPLLNVAQAGEARTDERQAVWAGEGMTLQALEARRSNATPLTLSLPPTATELTTLQGNTPTDQVPVPQDALLQGEWPWRLSALPFEVSYNGTRPLILVDDAGEAHVQSARVLVQGGEPTITPAGNFVTWKVLVVYEREDGSEVRLSAWYDATPPHPLVRYEDGTVRYMLTSVETPTETSIEETP